MIIELERLDLQKEHNISKIIKNNWDLWALLFLIAMFVSYAYETYLPLIPFVMLLMVYVIVDDNEDQVKENNDVKLNHALKQNNWFELVRNNAYKWVDEG